ADSAKIMNVTVHRPNPLCIWRTFIALAVKFKQVLSILEEKLKSKDNIDAVSKESLRLLSENKNLKRSLDSLTRKRP
ncbi:hypothetical protein, partial [Nibrella saemangeumensis]|uniref:hypothetical protein n=1 Tax=Nibrella saemangeumensis TaxID=1084526 RepID=UPI0031E5FB7D